MIQVRVLYRPHDEPGKWYAYGWRMFSESLDQAKATLRRLKSSRQFDYQADEILPGDIDYLKESY